MYTLGPSFISDKQLFRGLSIDSESLNIYGATERPFKVKYIPRRWITISIQWIYDPDDMRGTYFLYQGHKTAKRGTFTTTKIEKDAEKKLYIGALYDGRQPWSGCLVVLDIINVANPPDTFYPEIFISLIAENHTWRVKEGYNFI